MATIGSLPEHVSLQTSDRQQIEAIVASLYEVLREDLVGAYLHGSAVLDGLRPRSDIDVMAVSARRSAPDQKRRLVGRLLEISGRDPAASPPRPVELTIVVLDEIRPWRYPPTMDFQYGEWWRDEFAAGDIEPWPSRTNPDVAPLVKMVLPRRRDGLRAAAARPLQARPGPRSHRRDDSCRRGGEQRHRWGQSECRPHPRPHLEHRRDRHDPVQGWGGRLGAPTPRTRSPGGASASPQHLPGDREGALGRPPSVASPVRGCRQCRDPGSRTWW